jgi:hypothetical protein
MVAARRIDKLELLYEWKLYSGPSWVTNIHVCKSFFPDEGVLTKENVAPHEGEHTSNSGSPSTTETVFLVETNENQRWGADCAPYDKGRTIWGIDKIKAVTCVQHGLVSDDQISDDRIAKFELEYEGMSKEERAEKERVMDDRCSAMANVAWDRDY